MKKYLMGWLCYFTLFCMSTFWLVYFMLAGGDDGRSFVIFLICLLSHFVCFGLCIYAAVAGKWAAEREEKRQKQREEEQKQREEEQRGAPSASE